MKKPCCPHCGSSDLSRSDSTNEFLCTVCIKRFKQSQVLQGNVTRLPTAMNPDSVLEQAIGGYRDVLIIGHDHGGMIDSRASTNIQRRDILWMIEEFKNKILFE